MVTITTLNGILETPTENTSWKELFASWLLALGEEWFGSHEFPTGIVISDKKYKYLGFKYKSCFYVFNDQLDYNLAHYCTISRTTKGNMNMFLTDLLITSLTKKLSYKNADEWMKKAWKIS